MGEVLAFIAGIAFKEGWKLLIALLLSKGFKIWKNRHQLEVAFWRHAQKHHGHEVTECPDVQAVVK